MTYQGLVPDMKIVLTNKISSENVNTKQNVVQKMKIIFFPLRYEIKSSLSRFTNGPAPYI